jgi:hypothetical protein
MKKLIITTLFIFISSCGYDGHYRYECQDPQNWSAEYCNPPICLVDGMCTETLLGFNPEDLKEENNLNQENSDEDPAVEPLETVDLLEEEE